MKRLISLVLALLLCAAGFAAAEVMDVTGDWYLNVFETDGMQHDPAVLGMEMSLTFNPDGTAVMTSHGRAADMGTWTLSGSSVTITDSTGVSMVAQLEDGEMVITEEGLGGSLVLGREKKAPSGYIPAAVESDPALGDFEGKWSAALIDMNGMQLPMEVLGMKLVIEISGETASVTDNKSGVDETYETSATLDGSTLTIAASGDEMPMPLQLQQDGKVVYADADNGLIMYFEKIK